MTKIQPIKLHEAMPKTTELWNSIVKETDIYPHMVSLGEFRKELVAVQDKLNKVESVREFNELNEKKDELQRKIKELEVTMRTQKHRFNKVLKEDVPKLSTLYNEEFKPFHKEYIELNKKVKAESKKFAESVLPLLQRMHEIEKLELTQHSIKTFGNLEANPNSKYIHLPIEQKGFDQQPAPHNMRYIKAREHSSTTKLARVASHLLSWK